MAAVSDLERFLERVFERTSARLFRSRVRVVQVERRVERAMEAGRTGRGSSTVVPNRYRVRLHPADLDDLAGEDGGYEALAARLADRALAFARLHGYHVSTRPTVSVVADPIVERGVVEVDASIARATAAPPPAVVVASVVAQVIAVPEPASSSGDPGASWPADREPVAPLPVRVLMVDELAVLVAPAPLRFEAASPGSAADAPETYRQPPIRPQPPISPADPAAPEAAIARTANASGLRNVGERRYTVRPAAPPPTRAVLRVTEPGGREREIRVEGQPLTLGRAPDNGLVIADARVSRHHGRFQNRNGTLVYTDLGSTNGTRVNGIRVDEIVLGSGDRLQVGDVVVVVEQLPR